MVKANDFIDDLEMLKKGIDPADIDDDGGEGFKGEPMFVQLGKVLDSAGNPNPVTKVKTDDGKEFDIDVAKAKTLRMLMTTDKIKPNLRNDLTKDLQRADGLGYFLEKEPKEYIQAFVDKYMKK